jgi:hypothetical protein
MPLPPPVTTATLPSNSDMFSFFLDVPSIVHKATRVAYAAYTSRRPVRSLN